MSQPLTGATSSIVCVFRHPACRRKRVMARRRSPRRRRGSSDAARTLVPRERGTAGGRCLMTRGREESRGKAVACRMFVRVGCPKAGLGVVGGKGPPRPLIPCRPPRRRPGPDVGLKPPSSDKSKKRSAPYPLPPAAQATRPGRRAEAAIQRQKQKRGDRSPQEKAVMATGLKIPSRDSGWH